MREDWVECKLEDVLSLKNGFAFKSSKYKEEGIPIIRISDIQQGFVISDKAKRISESEEYDDYQVEYGDILIAMSGATTGKFGVYKSNEKTYQNQRVGNLKLLSDKVSNKKFVYYLLFSLKQQIEKDAYGGAQPNISGKKIEALRFLLPPLPEQRAIVAKIEQLFSELDNGIANLQAAKDKLAIYRQAVLKKAFEGELTQAWRTQQTDGRHSALPTADELLKQIKTERDSWVEEEIANSNTEAKRLKSKLKKNKVITPDHEPIPPSWNWTTFLDACHLVVDCHNKTAPYENSGIFLIRTSNVKNGHLNLKNDIRFVSQDTYEYWSRRCFPEPEDILFTREAPMGEAAIIPKNTKVCLGQRMMLLRVFSELLLPKYLLYNRLFTY